jgi:hypoxanthine phosphoribosyltransferase
MIADLQEILVSEDQIRRRIPELAGEISRRYQDADELTIIAIINGAVPFTADLIRHITIPIRLDCIRVSSYQNSTTPVGEPQIIDTLRLDLAGRHVLIIDDILDTGRTIRKVMEAILRLHPASVALGVLLEKKVAREVMVQPDFVGFTIPDAFVVGYGLDFAEHYRQLPCIGILKPEYQNPPEWR